MREDDTLWTQVRHGNVPAFEKLHAAYYSRVRNFLKRYLGDGAVVDDVAQETFLQFWRRPDRFDPERSKLKAYLFGIARKKAADWRRHHNPAIDSRSEPAVASSDSQLLISDALNRLDADLRNILWLREVEGYSYDELASMLDIPIGTVKSRLFSAREQLRTIWNKSD